VVELKNVSVTYSSGVDALNNVSLKINDGDFAFVVGSSGAGKSTMIKLLLREIEATSGVVTVNGYNLSKLKKRQIPEFRRTIGFVFQDFRLIPSMTVYENIAFVLRVIDAPIKHIRKRVPYVISLVGLQAKSNSYPDELSGGEKQRVAIARALVNDPQLIIADEPTGNIDPELSYEIVELLKSINDQGTTILMVTHEHDLVRHFGGRIISITDGEIVFDEVIIGVNDELAAEAAENSSEYVREDLTSEIDADDMIAPVSEVNPDDIIAAITEGAVTPTENIAAAITEDAPPSSAEDIIAAITEDAPASANEVIASITEEAPAENQEAYSGIGGAE
jgi:cell division ATP-binding protein FtsE